MKYLFTYFFILVICFGNAQNLVPNYSFENYSVCPLSAGEVTLAIPWSSATATCSTDYFNTCSTGGVSVPNNGGGYQPARTGSAYAGFWFYGASSSPNGREYLQVKLDSILKPNICYYTQFYVNLGDISGYACNNIAANFAVTQPFSTLTTLMPLTPHIMNTGNPIINDSINWVKISGYYTAIGGEQYLTIGNFFDDANTSVFVGNPTGYPSYYYIDDITVEEVKVKQWNYTNTILCLNESVVLNPNTNDTNAYALNWMPTTNLSCANCNSPIAQPQSTTTYTLTKQRCNITTTDTVRVTVKDCNPTIEIPNVFTPNGDGINDTFNFSVVGASDVSFIIYNRWGNIIKNSTLNTNTYFSWDGRTTSGEACSDGVYFYTLTYKLVNGDTETKKGFITLMR